MRKRELYEDKILTVFSRIQANRNYSKAVTEARNYSKAVTEAQKRRHLSLLPSSILLFFWTNVMIVS